ncbi:hypothetical protein PybrP1_005008 [[Pythium] brassicae (nom. inval.)]|nr:hypothetical protein PybrP1_005008 [[Pythium] brassicae (nom. inval.)]
MLYFVCTRHTHTLPHSLALSMDESDEQHAASATSDSAKSGPQLLHELLAIVYHVLEEAKYMNLKPPLQPSSRLFSVDHAGSPPDSPTADEHADANGGLGGAFGGGFGVHGHGGGHAPVIPYAPEEIQDSYTKIAHLKNQYVRLSAELLDAIKRVESGAPPSNKEVYERNLVMKELIDRLRHLQHSIRIMKGGSAYPTEVVMESSEMIPPRYAKTASLTNTTAHSVVVTATFGSDEQVAEGREKYTETLTLAPGQTGALPEHEYDMGGWTAVAALDSLKVAPEDASANGALALSHFQPAVDSVVGVLHVEIQAPSASSAYHFAVTKQD